MAKKKSRYQPITAFKRSVTFDGRGEMVCERCGTVETFTPPVYPSMPREQYDWIQKFNSRVLGFLKKHRECA